jgi:hypothetical protein
MSDDHRQPTDEQAEAVSTRVAHFMIAAGTREGFERRQRVVRVAVEKMQALRLGHDVDESFYDAWRECLLTAGATEGDINALAEYFVRFIGMHRG